MFVLDGYFKLKRLDIKKDKLYIIFIVYIIYEHIPNIYSLTENGIRILLTTKLKEELNNFLYNSDKKLKEICKLININ